MTATIWAGAGNASDVLLLIAAVVAAVDVAIHLAGKVQTLALLPAAVCLIALGLLAL